MEYFATLNLDRSASLRDVDRSYKNFARYYHPDKAREFDNPEEFREILGRIYLAHEILSNEILFELCKRYYNDKEFTAYVLRRSQLMKNDRSTTPPSVDKLARYYEEYYKYKRLIHKIRFGRFVLSMEGIQQTIGFYDNTESNLVELNMKMDLMNLFKEIKLDYKSRLETTSGNYSYGLKVIHKGPQTSENSDVSIYYPTEYFHKSQYIVTPIVNVCTNRLKICPTVRISHSIRESEVFNDQGQRSLKRHFIFVKGIVLDTVGFELEKNITKCYRKIRGIKKSDEREYLERPVLDYQFRLKQIAIQRIRMQQIHDLVDKKISLSDLIKRDVFCPFEFTLALNKFGTTQLITRWDPIRSHQCLVELTNNTFTIPFVDFQIQLEYKVKFTDGLSYKAMKPEGNIKLIRVQSENGEPVKKEATFDDIIMLVFFLNQDPRCKDSRYKVGNRLFVARRLAVMINYLMIQESGLTIQTPLSMPFSIRRFVSDSETAFYRVIMPILLVSAYRKFNVNYYLNMAKNYISKIFQRKRNNSSD